MNLWPAVAVAALGCMALKGAGHLLSARAAGRSRVTEVLDALPVALLSALVAVSTFTSSTHLVLDSRAAGLLVAVLLVAVRAPFLVVVVAACAAAAGLHVLHP